MQANCSGIISKKHQSTTVNLSSGEVLLIDKPEQWTSYDVIRYLKSRLDEKKLGHAGTLDPMATGLLILCSGKATKRISEFQDLPKTYTGTIRLGGETPSFDRETEVIQSIPTTGITEKMICEAAKHFTGTIEQVPPAYSAIKLKGQRAYVSARKGREVELKARTVHIESFNITGIRLPDVHFEIKCSKGTYIRAIARDLGRKLDNGGYLCALRRTAIGPYNVDDAFSPGDAAEYIHSCQNVK